MGDRLRTTDAEIAAALERAANEPDAPTAVEVRYLPSPDLLLMVMKSGQRVAIPREEIQVLASAPRKQVAEVEIENFGTALHWPQLDLDLSVEGLLKGVTGNRRWMQELKLQRRRRAQMRTPSAPAARESSVLAG
ncbi:DUF2442 domain-containing protein [Granulicella aggregans]|uniref:DUF2442 domain-containing protein n=1 Tax=Granulicella aggregans TaxID=474949 RepID=UPI0021DF5B6C|nr:DUF2442 domain-containing protein [Granulicella aggregans]